LDGKEEGGEGEDGDGDGSEGRCEVEDVRCEGNGCGGLDEARGGDAVGQCGIEDGCGGRLEGEVEDLVGDIGRKRLWGKEQESGTRVRIRGLWELT
jgi:hypothetical protein